MQSSFEKFLARRFTIVKRIFLKILVHRQKSIKNNMMINKNSSTKNQKTALFDI